MIGISTQVALRPHRVTFEVPGEPVPDGEGGWSEGTTTDLATLFVRIRPATGADAERVAPGTVLSRASYLVDAPFFPGLTTQARMRFKDRIFNVIGYANREERDIDLTIVCDEVIA